MSQESDYLPINSFYSRLNEARKGSTEAIGELLNSYRNYLLKIATQEHDRILWPKESPSDLVGDTILKALEQIAQFRGETERAFKKWLRVILLRAILRCRERFVKAEKRKIDLEVSLELLASKKGDNFDLPLAADSPLAKLIQTEAIQLLITLIQESMPRPFAFCLLWRYREGLSYEEIAKECRCSVTQAKKFCKHGLQRLHNLLSERPSQF